ncbi:hypothetical protein JCM8097_001451 [Rhodosporidiobolus ruineniae]
MSSAPGTSPWTPWFGPPVGGDGQEEGGGGVRRTAAEGMGAGQGGRAMAGRLAARGLGLQGGAGGPGRGAGDEGDKATPSPDFLPFGSESASPLDGPVFPLHHHSRKHALDLNSDNNAGLRRPVDPRFAPPISFAASALRSATSQQQQQQPSASDHLALEARARLVRAASNGTSFVPSSSPANPTQQHASPPLNPSAPTFSIPSSIFLPSTSSATSLPPTSARLRADSTPYSPSLSGFMYDSSVFGAPDSVDDAFDLPLPAGAGGLTGAGQPISAFFALPPSTKRGQVVLSRPGTESVKSHKSNGTAVAGGGGVGRLSAGEKSEVRESARQKRPSRAVPIRRPPPPRPHAREAAAATAGTTSSASFFAGLDSSVQPRQEKEEDSDHSSDDDAFETPPELTDDEGATIDEADEPAAAETEEDEQESSFELVEPVPVTSAGVSAEVAASCASALTAQQEQEKTDRAAPVEKYDNGEPKTAASTHGSQTAMPASPVPPVLLASANDDEQPSKREGGSQGDEAGESPKKRVRKVKSVGEVAGSDELRRMKQPTPSFFGDFLHANFGAPSSTSLSLKRGTSPQRLSTASTVGSTTTTSTQTIPRADSPTVGSQTAVYGPVAPPALPPPAISFATSPLSPDAASFRPTPAPLLFGQLTSPFAFSSSSSSHPAPGWPSFPSSFAPPAPTHSLAPVPYSATVADDARLDMLQKMAREAVEQTGALKHKMAKYEKRHQTDRAEKAQLASNLDAAQVQLEAATTQLEAFRREVEEKRRQLEAQGQAFKGRVEKGTLEEWQKRARAAEEQLGKAKAEGEAKFERERKELEGRVREAEEKEGAWKERVKGVKEELEAEKKKGERVAVMEKALAQVEEEKEAALTDAKSASDALSTANASHAAALEKAQSDLRLATRDRDIQQRTASDLHADRERLAQRLGGEVERLREEKASLEEELESKTADLTEAVQAIALLKESTEKLPPYRDIVDELLSSSLDDLHILCSACTSTRTLQNGRIDTLTAQLDASNGELERFKNRAAGVLSSLEKRVKAAESSAASSSSLRAKLNLARSQTEQLEGELKSAKAAHRSAELQLEGAEKRASEAERAKSGVEGLFKIKLEEKGRVEGEVKEEVGRLRAEVARLAKENTALNAQLDKTSADMGVLITQMEAEKDHAQRQCGVYKARAEELEREKAEAAKPKGRTSARFLSGLSSLDSGFSPSPSRAPSLFG